MLAIEFLFYFIQICIYVKYEGDAFNVTYLQNNAFYNILHYQNPIYCTTALDVWMNYILVLQEELCTVTLPVTDILALSISVGCLTIRKSHLSIGCQGKINQSNTKVSVIFQGFYFTWPHSK